MFTTRSHDNDMSKTNCAVTYGAPWWFRNCHQVFLTGEYGENISHAKGITWRNPWGFDKFARSAAMMIRPNT